MSSLPILVPPHSMHHSTLFTPPIIMKPDSGASGTYVREQDATVLSSIVPSTSHQVMLPDGNNIQSTKTGLLPIPGLSDVAATAHVFKDLHSASLLSVGQLCDDDCLVLFDKGFMRVFKHNKEILRNPLTPSLMAKVQSATTFLQTMIHEFSMFGDGSVHAMHDYDWLVSCWHQLGIHFWTKKYRTICAHKSLAQFRF